MPDLIPIRWPLAQRRLSRYQRDHVSRRMGPHEEAIKGAGTYDSAKLLLLRTPILSKRVLKELTPNGEASIGVNIAYNAPPRGEMRIAVWAFAMISLPSASSFSIFGRKDKDANVAKKEDMPYEVSLVLDVVVKKLVENMIIKMKKPLQTPSFTPLPQMEISIEPIVSAHQIRWSMIVDSVVLPYVDCIPFFDTTHNTTRGVIFGSIPRDARRHGVVLSNAIIRKG
ncbi:hypothetical protein M422DRAFT_250262 [Sphaerobolus stellatus SS14]|uniref:Uncharacterized protein n=1 Tax=Sphaerobolus stellatus (strain SS14) TaxID=990650 RepID=A0A0C9UTQ2_SPHS4|nr:hypothetical protein M422DRAFT_250262 [Sphaerobolus stellatus SS14]